MNSPLLHSRHIKSYIFFLVLSVVFLCIALNTLLSFINGVFILTYILATISFTVLIYFTIHTNSVIIVNFTITYHIYCVATSRIDKTLSMEVFTATITQIGGDVDLTFTDVIVQIYLHSMLLFIHQVHNTLPNLNWFVIVMGVCHIEKLH